MSYSYFEDAPPPPPPPPPPRPPHRAKTPNEIERLRAWIKQRRRRGSCHPSRGEIEIEHNLEEFQKLASESDEFHKRKELITIYRVPKEIYSCDKKAYQPKAVCIGPFFYGRRDKQHLASMQLYKWACVKRLMSKHNEPRDLLGKCLREMKNLEECVRSCYSETFSRLNSVEFTKMLLLDGCFLLHLLLRHADSGEKPKVGDDDAAQAAGRLWIWNLVKYDLLLLENQIPFFVIQSLYELLKPDDDNNTNLVDCAINLFSTLEPCRKQKRPKFYIPVEKVEHLLHLIYLSVLPCPQYCRSSSKTQPPQWIPNATELKQAGMKFKKRKNERGFLSFLDVKFSDGVMEIPQLKLLDYSVSLFRNFIAFEQCYANTQCQVTVYAAFMDYLITTEKDVRLLNQNDILINSMTIDKDKDAQHFFSRLCNEVHYAQDTNYLQILFTDVTEYHHSTWPRLRSYLYRNLASTPWAFISMTVSSVVLLLTIYNVFFR